MVNPIFKHGRLRFANRSALAQHLAKVTGQSVNVCASMLYRNKDDADEVVARLRQREVTFAFRGVRTHLRPVRMAEIGISSCAMSAGVLHYMQTRHPDRLAQLLAAGEWISFMNGRHRFVWMRDHGVKRLPVQVRGFHTAPRRSKAVFLGIAASNAERALARSPAGFGIATAAAAGSLR